jgi:hypothetical protein
MFITLTTETEYKERRLFVHSIDWIFQFWDNKNGLYLFRREEGCTFFGFGFGFSSRSGHLRQFIWSTIVCKMIAI